MRAGGAIVADDAMVSDALCLADLSVSLSDAERSFRLEVPDLSLSAGETVGLSGQSGTGKTLFLETLGLLRAPGACAQFTLSAAGQQHDLTALWHSGDAQRDAPSLRGHHFGFIPQSGGLLPFLTVQENIALSQRISGAIDNAWHTELSDRLGLTGLSSLHPGALSIGQRQRVAIARALAHRPAFVIADEPTAALDPDNAAEAMGLLFETAAEGGAGVLVSSHDLDLMGRFDMRRIALALVPGAPHDAVVSRLEAL